MEGVFGGVYGDGQESGQGATEQAYEHARQQAMHADIEWVFRDREKRAKAQKITTQDCRGGAGESDRNEAAGLPFKEQQLDSQEHGGERRGEGGGHARSGARDEQRLALGAGEMEELGDHGADGAAGHDNGAFRAEGTARADGNRGRDWFEKGDLGLDAAAVDEDGFDGLGNAVSADAL